MFVISTVEEKIQDGMMVKKRVRTCLWLSGQASMRG